MIAQSNQYIAVLDTRVLAPMPWCDTGRAAGALKREGAGERPWVALGVRWPMLFRIALR
jgi:hypothetical protein